MLRKELIRLKARYQSNDFLESIFYILENYGFKGLQNYVFHLVWQITIERDRIPDIYIRVHGDQTNFDDILQLYLENLRETPAFTHCPETLLPRYILPSPHYISWQRNYEYTVYTRFSVLLNDGLFIRAVLGGASLELEQFIQLRGAGDSISYPACVSSYSVSIQFFCSFSLLYPLSLYSFTYLFVERSSIPSVNLCLFFSESSSLYVL